ncbi:dynamin family protein [Oscillatoriales cyanobacterium LEGE 11467]|uniref:Dynamin family protein n=1 Tax=Zarconia navalis LEGE 11467 TaxID=1828826 RepID=A0A928VUG8_9CYAN|nr:dynamin family protein [Zarconia navalis]MBE9039674.1 dynamin family protein [Zarconia navalis LEGE 11467]
MVSQLEKQSLIDDLDRFAETRREIADRLSQIAETIERGEAEGETRSGKFELATEITDCKTASENLKNGVFRLLVLGDLKRGKSTLLNALLGEKLLPSDVNPCTAILTVLRYGTEKQVTLFFKNDRPPQKLDVQTFVREYTIDPDEAKTLEARSQLAFSEVDYAVIEYPLPLLKKGIEIIDTPGLNDTEARNQLTLGYLNKCHAVLFVLDATQPLTLDEHRYLDNYIKDRGLTVFFILNGWDKIRKGAIDLDDPEELAEAENKIRTVFKTNLSPYCQVDGQNFYEEWVFEVSALNALRQKLKFPDRPIEETGLPALSNALNTFLTQERAVAELRQARTLGSQAHNRLRKAIERRIPLLDRNVEELKQRIRSTQPEFDRLKEIRDRFQAEIHQTRDRQAKEISESFRSYILDLGSTFETDFVRYQPELQFLDALSQGKRDEFKTQFQRAFERYINEKVLAWERTAERDLSKAFSQLAQSASSYGTQYTQIIDSISEKSIGQNVRVHGMLEDEKIAPGWANWAMGFVSLATGNVAGVVLAGAGFDWKNILVNYLGVIGISSFLLIFSGGLLASIGIWGIPLLGLGVGTFQVDKARQELIRATKKEFVKYLPQLAQEQQQGIYDTVIAGFEDYEREVIGRIDGDIASRKAELDNLLDQKESRQIDRDAEVSRLQTLETEVRSQVEQLDGIYRGFFAAIE